MIYLISGASHAGKTALAQRLLEKHKYPYLSIDHLKMGLIRSKNTELNALSDDDKLTAYLWPIVAEIIKTAIENEQNLIVEGCYVPFDWKNSFDESYLSKIKYLCLILSENYINNHFEDIIKFANIIENRLYDDCSIDEMIAENNRNLEMAQKHKLDYILIDDNYDIDIE